MSEATTPPQPTPSAPPSDAPKAPPGGPTPFTFRLAIGLLGILIAAMIAGLNNRVPSLILVDIQGALGFNQDSAAWLSTAYSAGEIAAMPFATWCAITFSLRRFHCFMLISALSLAFIMPFIHRLDLLLLARGLQGFFSGALIPLLMMAALRFLPLTIRLHGLALYALTATFAPNISFAVAAYAVDYLQNWHWAYWVVIPFGLVALVLVYWGIPKMPPALPRIKQANWLGMGLGIIGLSSIVVALDQGVRLEWFHSPIIQASLLLGVVFSVLFILTEWFHPSPFIKLQLLGRRNLGLGFSAFFILLILMASSVTVPSNLLAHSQGFRLAQTAHIGLLVGLPQLVLGSVVALLIYQKWIDARYLFALGLACIAMACWMASHVTSAWMFAQFIPAEILQAIGQPLAIVSMLFLATSVVHPMEGPYVAGMVNTIRAFGAVFGGCLVNQYLTVKFRTHQEYLIDQVASNSNIAQQSSAELHQFSSDLIQQANILASADLYRMFMLVALCLIPVVLSLKYIPSPLAGSPTSPTPPTATPQASPVQGKTQH